MQTLDLPLPAGGATHVTEADCADGSLLHLALAGTHALTVEGVEVTIGAITAHAPDAALTLTAGEGATVFLDQGLLRAEGLSAASFRIEGRGEIHLDGGNLRGQGGLLARHHITFCAGHGGIFTYTPPQAKVVHMTTFHVAAMQSGDCFMVTGWTMTGQPRPWNTGEGDAISVTPAAYDTEKGILPVHYTSGLSTTRLEIPMTPAAAEEVLADWARPPAFRQYWRPVAQGGVQTGLGFHFPGAASGCAQGTLFDTPEGPRPVESLRPGDWVTCADGRAREVVRVAATRRHEVAARMDLRPIRIKVGALGGGYPASDLLLAPAQRLWVSGPAIRAVAGGGGALVAAKHLLGLPGIVSENPVTPVYYHEVMLAGAAIVTAHGVPVATATPRDMLPCASRPYPQLGGRVARQVMRLYGRRREMLFETPPRVEMRHPPRAAEFAAE